MLTITLEGDSDKELTLVDLRYIRQQYDYPHMVGHRASLAGSLFEGCKREKAIKFFFSTAACGVESWGALPSLKVKPRNGDAYTIKPDVLIAADGIKSVIRDQMLQELHTEGEILDTDQACYRIMLTREQMGDDAELLELLDTNRVTRWIGEKRHIIAYPVSNKTIYNLSTVQPDKNFADAPSATYTTKGSKSVMLDTFGDFCPKVQKMLNLVPDGEVCEWRLRVHSPLPTWVHGSVALLGDACHATLPHMGQGAAQAIEDAAVIAVVLGRMPDHSPATINKSLRVYQELRKARAEKLVELAAESGRSLHLGEGEAKRQRDAQFKAGGKVPDKWADADVQKDIYGHDCVRVAEESFDSLFASI